MAQRGRRPSTDSLDLAYDEGLHRAFVQEKRELARRFHDVQAEDERILAEMRTLENVQTSASA